jgi:hypothetical protein
MMMMMMLLLLLLRLYEQKKTRNVYVCVLFFGAESITLISRLYYCCLYFVVLCGFCGAQ